MISLAINKRGPVGPTVDFPGETPEERYEWCIKHMSRSQRRHMENERQVRFSWLRVHNPNALKARAA